MYSYSFMFSLGTMVGTVAAMSLSGLLCASTVDNGWPLIFYVFGKKRSVMSV